MLKDSGWYQLAQEPRGRPDVSHSGNSGFCSVRVGHRWFIYEAFFFFSFKGKNIGEKAAKNSRSLRLRLRWPGHILSGCVGSVLPLAVMSFLSWGAQQRGGGGLNEKLFPACI